MFNKPHDIEYCGVDKLKIQNACPVLDREVRGHYVYFITERTNIYRLKEIEKLPSPWTKDEILGKYKFTNTRRELDKETKWLLNDLSSRGDYLTNKILSIALFRCINLGQFFDKCWGMEDLWRNQPNSTEIENPLKHFKAYKDVEQAYSGAAQSNAYFLSQMRRVANDRCKADGLNDLCYSNAALAYFIYCHRETIIKAFYAKSPELVCKILEEVPGFGPFMTYQIWVDFTFMSEHHFSENEFVISGPGCDEGIDFLFKDKDGMNNAECMFWLRDNWIEVTGINTHRLFDFLPADCRNFGVMQIENSFCELAKYMKLTLGVKMRPRFYTPSRLPDASKPC